MKRFLGRTLNSEVSFVLPIGMGIWGVIMGTSALLDLNLSLTMTAAPGIVARVWGASALASGIALLYGLFQTHSALLVARSLWWHALVVLAFMGTTVALVGFRDALSSIIVHGVVALSLLFKGCAIRAAYEGLRRLESDNTEE